MVRSMPTTRINDISMYYEVHGAGEPLLLIAGLGADMTLLAGLIGWLAQRYQVVAFDNCVVGRTDKPDAPYTIELMAQDTDRSDGRLVDPAGAPAGDLNGRPDRT
jgi:3-oxoadipate enol-lactonase